MRGLAERVLYATDAAQPAASGTFRRVLPEELPEGSADVPMRIFRARPPYQLGFSPGLWAALRRDVVSADLVTIHSLNLFPQYAAFMAAVAAGVPYIVTPHGALDPWLIEQRVVRKRVVNLLWQRRMLAQAAAIHFTTREEAHLARQFVGQSRCVIVPNGVAFSEFARPGSGVDFRVGKLQGYDGPTVLFVGRLARKKGLDILIRAFAAATRERDARLLIAGPDDEGLTPALQQEAARSGVADHVHFLGPLYGPDQRDALAAASVWALTSYTENFGNAVVEAMAAGCAVVVSDKVNLAREIERAGAGAVVRLDVNEIAALLGRLLDDPAMRRRLGARARDFARQFDWSVVAPRLVEMFDEAAGERTG